MWLQQRRLSEESSASEVPRTTDEAQNDNLVEL